LTLRQGALLSAAETPFVSTLEISAGDPNSIFITDQDRTAVKILSGIGASTSVLGFISPVSRKDYRVWPPDYLPAFDYVIEIRSSGAFI
jgi:hypothetical protein